MAGKPALIPLRSLRRADGAAGRPIRNSPSGSDWLQLDCTTRFSPDRIGGGKKLVLEGLEPPTSSVSERPDHFPPVSGDRVRVALLGYVPCVLVRADPLESSTARQSPKRSCSTNASTAQRHNGHEHYTDVGHADGRDDHSYYNEHADDDDADDVGYAHTVICADDLGMLVE